MSYAARDTDLAKAFTNFLRLGCNLSDEQVFTTARPGEIPAGSQFTEVIRSSLEEASMTVLLLTPSFYESRFCLGETGAVWVTQAAHVPVVVPPIDFASLDGVQLGEQAIRIDSPSGLDDLRDQVATAFDVTIPTSRWNEHKNDFLNVWTSRFEGQIEPAAVVPARQFEQLRADKLELEKLHSDLLLDVERLKDYTRRLAAQNGELRERVPAAPPAPELQGDETAEFIAEAEAAIEHAAGCMGVLPPIAREAIFQFMRQGIGVTVGGMSDAFGIDDARVNEELGYLNWVEDEPQVVLPRHDQPDVAEAEAALQRVQEHVFQANPYGGQAKAPVWIRPFLKTKYGLDDPTFSLRPTWEKLGFF